MENKIQELIYEENYYIEQLRYEEENQQRLNDLYTYGDDGFCDGFTKY
ncbi:MAG: hypothetical protein HPY57_15470 [Ignavibacteria bacterium]|nr:hypothetical protein [Ignavibacteria bacterium]